MEDKFLFDRDCLEDFKNHTDSINNSLENAFQTGKGFLEMLAATNLWAGQSKEEFQCFFHLVMQYHGQIVGETVPSIGKISTAKVNGKSCEIALDTLTELNRNMDEFTGNCRSYQELEKI